MPCTDERMTINTGTTQTMAVVKVNEFEERRMVLQTPFDVLIGAVARRINVAGVDSGPEPFILERLHKVQELIVVREEFRTLACRRLQKDRTAFGGRFHGLE